MEFNLPHIPTVEGEVCLEVMRSIAAGRMRAGDFEGVDFANQAVHRIGWMVRDPEDYFGRTCPTCGHEQPDYPKEQVLMALAWCVTLAECAPPGVSGGSEP